MSLGLFDDVPSLPSRVYELLEIDSIKRKYKTAQRIADEMLQCVQRWQRNHPGEDPMEIVPPDFREYIQYHIN